MGQGGPCSLEELHMVCNMDGLAYRFGSPSPFLPVPWRGRLLDTEVLHCPSVSPLLQLRGVGGGGGGGCSHSPCGPAYYLCLGLGQLSPGSMDLKPRVCDLLISFIDFKIV